MKFFGAFLLVCGLFAISYALPHPKAVAESESDDEKRFFWPQINIALEIAKKFQKDASNFCKQNSHSFPDILKRVCSCVRSFDAFGDEESEIPERNVVDEKRFFLPDVKKLLNALLQKAKDFCRSQDGSNETVTNICHCFTGQ